MKYQKMTAMFLAAGMTLFCFSGCSFSGEQKKAADVPAIPTVSPTPVASVTPKATATPKPTAAAPSKAPSEENTNSQSGSGSSSQGVGSASDSQNTQDHSQSENQGNGLLSENEAATENISGVLVDSDESSVTLEYFGSDDEIYQSVFDISNADIEIGGIHHDSGPLAASLNLNIGYYIDGDQYIARFVYGDGSEGWRPSIVKEQEILYGEQTQDEGSYEEEYEEEDSSYEEEEYGGSQQDYVDEDAAMEEY